MYFGVLSAWVCWGGGGRDLTYILLVKLFHYKPEYIFVLN